MATWQQMTVPPLSPRQVHVWQISLLADAGVLAEYGALLSVDERLRAARFAFPELHRRFVVGRSCLRQLLARYVDRPPDDLTFVYGPAGKPELAGGGRGGGGVQFNVSHSGEQALIAVASAESGGVGVDLELIRPLDWAGLACRILGTADQHRLEQADPAAQVETFFQLWVRHEAQLKAVGGTLGTPVDIPVYDLKISSAYRAALATAIPDPAIEMLNGLVE